MTIKFKHLTTTPKNSEDYELARIRYLSTLDDISDHMLSTIVAKQNLRPKMGMYYFEHPKINKFFSQTHYNIVVNALITRYNNRFNTNY